MSFVSKPKSISLLTQYFYPDLPGTAKIAKDIAFGLAKNGLVVNIYTGYPSYSSVNDTSEQLLSSNNIRVYRAYSPILSRKNVFSRLLNGLLVAVSISWKLLFKKHHIIVVDSTSPFLLVVTFLIRLIRKIPYIVLVHDVYPDIAIKLGVISNDSLLSIIWKKTYAIIYKWASRIVVLGDSMKKIVSKDFDQSTKAKLVIIPNWADGAFIKPLYSEKQRLKDRFGFNDAFIVIYSGNMGLTHDINTILKSAEKLAGNPKIEYLLIGGGGQFDSVVKFVSDKGLKNVKILPYQSEDIFPDYLACGDVSLVTLANGMEGLSVPSKIYSSLAAGLPIIGILNEESEIAGIIEENKCGYRTLPGNIETLVDAIKLLYSDMETTKTMGFNARQAFEKKYSKEIGVNKHVELVNSVLSEIYK